MRHILNQPALKSLGGKELEPSASAQSDAEIEQFIRQNADSIYHSVGTCKMDVASDPFAIVDYELKVHGIQGLRVVDASIMLTLIGGNTNAPTIMIAEKAPDLILRPR